MAIPNQDNSDRREQYPLFCHTPSRAEWVRLARHWHREWRRTRGRDDKEARRTCMLNARLTAA